MRGEWIEIRVMPGGHTAGRSLPMRGEWIEIAQAPEGLLHIESLPMRGEWIEIYRGETRSTRSCVSPHAGRVD